MVGLSRLLARPENRAALRTVAGLLFGLGFLMVFLRKSSNDLGDPWGRWALFATLLIVTAALFGTGLSSRLRRSSRESWEAVYMVFGTLLIPLLLFQLIDAVGGTAGAALNVAWVLLLTAAAGAFIGLAVDVRYGLLLGSIALTISWLSLWDKILSNGLGGHDDISRLLFVLIALVLVDAAYLLTVHEPLRRFRPARSDADEGQRRLRAYELVTGATIAVVGIGVIALPSFLAGSPFATSSAPSPTLFWDVVLLAASVLAVVWGAAAGVRGPVYAGGFGLFTFLLEVGLEAGVSDRSSTLVGWPLILVVLGAGLFALTARPMLRGGGESGQAPRSDGP